MKINAPDLHRSMIAAGSSRKKAEEQISKVTDGEVVVAYINSPSSVIISSNAQAIDQLLGLLKEEGIVAKMLQLDTSYRSHHMQLVAKEYYEILADVTALKAAGDCTMHSSVTGALI